MTALPFFYNPFARHYNPDRQCRACWDMREATLRCGWSVGVHNEKEFVQE